MSLRKNKILTGACLSLMFLASATAARAQEAETQKVAQAEIVAQGRFGGTAAQYEIVGHVRSIVGNVVTIHVEEESTIGVAGIAANDGEPTFVSVDGDERGSVRAIYMPHSNLGVTGLVPGMRIYASMSDRNGKECVDYFKVISAASYNLIDAGAVRGSIRRQFGNISSPVIPQLPEVQPPPRMQTRPRTVTPPPPPTPVRGLW